MGNRLLGLFLVLGSAIVGASAQTARQHADRIFENGKIWTADDARPQAQALGISGDKIMDASSNEEVHALDTTADTAVIDLQGRLAVPGFQNSNLRFPGQSVNEV